MSTNSSTISGNSNGERRSGEKRSPEQRVQLVARGLRIRVIEITND